MMMIGFQKLGRRDEGKQLDKRVYIRYIMRRNVFYINVL
jgi:hypothetical protein